VRLVRGDHVRAIADVNAEAVLNGTASFEMAQVTLGEGPQHVGPCLVETGFSRGRVGSMWGPVARAQCRFSENSVYVMRIYGPQRGHALS
jgi:hypothetical protein